MRVWQTFLCAFFHWPWHETTDACASAPLFEKTCHKCGDVWVETGIY